MEESATGTLERRMADTAERMKSTARRLTAEHGLTGFTVDELCAEVGVSRRTFFNYFASKENAVLGLPARLDVSGLVEQFVEAGEPHRAGLSPRLLDDFASLIIARWELLDLTADDVPLLMAAVDREPRLLAHLLALSEQSEREDILLIERRERLDAGDLRAETVVQLLGTILRGSAGEFFHHATTDTFHDIFVRRLAAARGVFAS
ncbi:TetR/AcrR family transcriptional regulator [Leifsonia poae]|uniref:TetR/AcrR family transcriptional regulator n=1 Tax=Leifsonia poae TaxID=110933 RepID=UPI003D66AA63